jgi:predicted PurR-regulated permease PerM
MAVAARTQVLAWGGAAVALGLVLWALGDILLPFVLGAALAYFLDPVADRLERLGLRRGPAVAVIALIATAVLALAVMLIVPALIAQGRALIEAGPAVLLAAQAQVLERFPGLADEAGPAREALQAASAAAQARLGALAGSILTSAQTLLGLLLLVVVVPVVTIYMLLDWDHMIARIDALLPRQHAPRIRRIAADIDRAIAAFVRGMGTVCLIMATYYGLGLMLAGLQFGLVVGFIAGILTFIPYVGAAIGAVLVAGLGLYQFWGDWMSLGLVLGVFLLGQTVESNVMTPRMVGQSIGLHPVWLLLAITVFATLFGLIGMVVAVPLAAAIGVVARHATAGYLASSLYTGTPPEAP